MSGERPGSRNGIVSVRGLIDSLRGDRLRFDALITSGSGLATFSLALVTGPLLARSLGAAGRGDLAAVVVPTQVLGYMMLFGLNHASAYYATERDPRTLLMNTWVVVAVVSAPVAAVLSLFVPDFLSGHDDMTVPWFYAFLCLTVLFLPVATGWDIVRGQGRSVLYNFLRVQPILFNAVGVILLAAVGHLTLRTALITAFTGTTTAYLITGFVTGGFPVRRPDLSLLRLQIAYGWRAALGTLSQMLLARYDQFLLVVLVDSDELGLYVVAATGASVSSPIGQGIALALFSHVRSSSDTEGASHTRVALRWAVMASAGVAACVAIVAPWGVPLLFGDEFQGSVAPMLLLLPGQVALDAANVNASHLEAVGRPGAASLGMGAGAIVTLVGVPLAVPILGIEGAAIVTSFSYGTYLAVVGWMQRQSRASVADELLST